MPRLSSISYSRDRTVAALTSYFDFLTTLYLPPECVLRAPPGGWPSITKESLAYLNKTDEVIELLRHLPYITDRLRYEVWPKTVFANWTLDSRLSPENEREIEGIRCLTDGHDWAEVPPHVIGLTSAFADWEDRLLLDTKLGVIYWLDCPFEIQIRERNETERMIEDHITEYAPEDACNWRSTGTLWPVEEFFEMAKDEFRALNFVPLGPGEVKDKYSNKRRADFQACLEKLRTLFTEFGWPGAHYRKDKYLQEVKETWHQLLDPSRHG